MAGKPLRPLALTALLVALGPACLTLDGEPVERGGSRQLLQASLRNHPGRASCSPGQADCDGDSSNGCEADVLESREHCGLCGHACRGYCSNGVCLEDRWSTYRAHREAQARLLSSAGPASASAPPARPPPPLLWPQAPSLSPPTASCVTPAERLLCR